MDSISANGKENDMKDIRVAVGYVVVNVKVGDVGLSQGSGGLFWTGEGCTKGLVNSYN